MNIPTLDYPCEYPVKVFVKPDDTNEAHIEALVRAELKPGASISIKRSLSQNSRYACLTLQFIVDDAEQAHRIGQVLRDAPEVLLAI